MKNFIFLMLVVLLCLFPKLTLALDPFLASPRPTGSTEIKLYPMENVTTGTPVLVTLGFPFPRGSVLPEALSQVRVLKGDTEIPAFVEMLSPWRHLSNTDVDGKSVRVARIQINYTFNVSYPEAETITVEWGQNDRAEIIESLTDPRTAWHQVTTGTFESADNIQEPDVYVVLPKTLLSAGILKPGKMSVFDDTVSAERDNPANIDGNEDIPIELLEQYARKNFFFSLINEDDARVTAGYRCDYKTTSGVEAWLFDRSSAMFVLYFRSGTLKSLREAVRSTQFYTSHIKANGILDLKSSYDDPKYSYNECMAYTYWLTGDNELLPKIETVVEAFSGVRTRWTIDMGFWTERHSGFKLLATAVAWEVTGKQEYKTGVLEISGDFIWLQNGAGGLIPEARVDGGLYHFGGQHDDDWESSTLGASPWMTGQIIVDAMLRVYQAEDKDTVAHFLRRMGNFLSHSCAKSSSGHDYPRYAVLYNGEDGQSDEWSDIQHALEVAAGVAWGYYFSCLLEQPDDSMKTKAQGLFEAYGTQVHEWIRPSGPETGRTAYRVSPWRKYNWEYRTSGSLSWLLEQEPGAIVIAPFQTVVGLSEIEARFQGQILKITTTKKSNVTVQLLTLTGRNIYDINYNAMPAGEMNVVIPVHLFQSGRYSAIISNDKFRTSIPVTLTP
ncbi:MAG: hypothetical protein HQK83_05700 [Fibrobacteria bacterium]|nr:hypothetical protein [Fibrobacteria bacterium]